MLQAWISAPAGSLYFAAPLSAYNLETLRQHALALRELRPARRSAQAPQSGVLHLSLGCAVEEGLAAKIEALVEDLRRAGIRVRMLNVDGVGSGEADGRGRERYPAASVAALTTRPQRHRGATAGRRRRSLGAAVPRGATSGSRG